MKLRIEAEPGELEEKASRLVLELARKLEKHDARLHDVVSLLEKSESPLQVPAVLQKARHATVRRTTFAGLPIAIENPAGSVRAWADPRTGRSGRTTMRYDYGFIEGVVGADGDGYDCFLGPSEDAPFAFVIHQRRPDLVDGHPEAIYDEDKVMLGFHSAHEAERAYLVHFDDPSFLGAMSQIPMAEFVEKLGFMNDGMVKGTRFVVKAAGLDPALATADSKMSDRAVSTGTAGINIASGSAPRQPAPTNIESPDSVRHALESVQEEHGNASGIKRDKEIYSLREIEQLPLHPVSEWETRIDEDSAARDEGPNNLAYIQDRLDRRQWNGNAPNHLHPRDPRPLLTVPYSKAYAGQEPNEPSERGTTEPDELDEPEALDDEAVGVAQKSYALQKSLAPDTYVESRLLRSISVDKLGLGPVTLDVYDSGWFFVRVDNKTSSFGSLSAACDYVWALQKGYASAEAWKEANGKRKLPSGAGWKFWGLDPKEMSS